LFGDLLRGGFAVAVAGLGFDAKQDGVSATGGL
jgi:hypothetical protein